jgi:hypothetical protein
MKHVVGRDLPITLLFYVCLLYAKYSFYKFIKIMHEVWFLLGCNTVYLDL